MTTTHDSLAQRPRNRRRILVGVTAGVVVLAVAAVFGVNTVRAAAERNAAVESYEAAVQERADAVSAREAAAEELAARWVAAKDEHKALTAMGAALTVEVSGDKKLHEAFTTAVADFARIAHVEQTPTQSASATPRPTATPARTDEYTATAKTLTAEAGREEKQAATARTAIADVDDALTAAVEAYNALRTAAHAAGVKLDVSKADKAAQTAFTTALAGIDPKTIVSVSNLTASAKAAEDYAKARAAAVTAHTAAVAAEKAAAEKAANPPQEGAPGSDEGGWDDNTGGGDWSTGGSSNSGGSSNTGGGSSNNGGSAPSNPTTPTQPQQPSQPSGPSNNWAPLRVSFGGTCEGTGGGASATYGSTLTIPSDYGDYWTYEIPGYGWGVDWECDLGF